MNLVEHHSIFIFILIPYGLFQDVLQVDTHGNDRRSSVLTAFQNKMYTIGPCGTLEQLVDRFFNITFITKYYFLTF